MNETNNAAASPSRSPAMAPVAWKTTHPAVCVPITEDREIAEQWRAHGYQVIEFFDRPVPAMAAEAVALPQPVLDALRFYANGHHFTIDDDHQQFDTVSGEPQNWLCSERDDDGTMIEDGSIAKAALCGGLLGFEEPEKPLEGEVFAAAPQPAQADARVGLTDEQILECATRRVPPREVPKIPELAFSRSQFVDVVRALLQGTNHAE